MRKVLIILSALLSLYACNVTAKTHISQAELLQSLAANKPPIIIDARSNDEYQSGHIPNAINVPFWTAVSSEKLRDLPHDQPVVVYCEHGPRAGLAKVGLLKQGFQNIRYLEGHMSAWRKAGNPIVTPGLKAAPAPVQ